MNIRKELNLALEQLKNNKATGLDLMKSQLLKNADKEVKEIIYEKIQECYITGNILNDFTTNKLIMIPKIVNAAECAYCRTLSLILHTSKIVLTIVKIRIKYKVENNIDDDQFGFRPGKEIKASLLKHFVERTYITFVHIEKAIKKFKAKTRRAELI